MSKVLIVEDERGLRELLKEQFELWGYEAITAKDGMEGLEKARSLNPNLIILDIIMPKVDGYEVCRLLKFDKRFQHIPIMMFTVKAEEVDKAMGKKVGADDYITKPFNMQDLLAKAKKYLNGSS